MAHIGSHPDQETMPTQIGCAILKLPALLVRGCDPRQLFGL